MQEIREEEQREESWQSLGNQTETEGKEEKRKQREKGEEGSAAAGEIKEVEN